MKITVTITGTVVLENGLALELLARGDRAARLEFGALLAEQHAVGGGDSLRNLEALEGAVQAELFRSALALARMAPAGPAGAEHAGRGGL